MIHFVDLDKLKCVVCDNDIKSTFSIEAFNSEMRWGCWGYDKFIIKCGKCGLMFIYPQWTQEELNKLYDGYCDQKDFGWQKQAIRITKYLPKYIPNKKDLPIILEIGCGKGDNVKRLQTLGYITYGIDKDPTYCDKTYNIYNEDYKTYSNSTYIDGWDFVYAIQVFEHIDNPKDFIEKIYKMVDTKRRGKFLLEFPNTDDPILSLYHVEKFKKFYYIPHHLFFWTPKTVKKFFDKTGIKVKIKLLQKYGILNHLRWIMFGVPGNWHPHIPILDNIYKFILTNIFKVSDTIIVIGSK
jgi:SAM-dependent methyltransferase